MTHSVILEQKDGKIHINLQNNARKGYFYLGYDYFKKNTIKILISIK